MKTLLVNGICDTDSRFKESVLSHLTNRIMMGLHADPKTEQRFSTVNAFGVSLLTVSSIAGYSSVLIRCSFGKVPGVTAEVTGYFSDNDAQRILDAIQLDLDVSRVSSSCIERFTPSPSLPDPVDLPMPEVIQEDVRPYLTFAFQEPLWRKKNQIWDPHGVVRATLRALNRETPYKMEELRTAIANLRMEKRHAFDPEIEVLDIADHMVQQGWIRFAHPTFAHRGFLVRIPDDIVSDETASAVSE